MRHLRDQSGVAMVTVLLVAAVLTVTASTATFLTIQEFRQGSDDRRAAGALAYAEAGVDRAMQGIRGGSWASTVLSGCQDIPSSVGLRDFDVRTWEGSIGNGSFEVVLERVDGCTGPQTTGIPRFDDPQELRIISTGKQPTAKRVVEQTVEVTRGPLPIGLHGGSVGVNGSPGVRLVSIVSLTDVTGREKIQFQGTDSFYDMSDLYFCYEPTTPGCIAEGSAEDVAAPAAAHAAGNIYSTNGTVEHPYTGTCAGLAYWNGAAPGSSTDIKTQAVWDGSSSGGTPPSGCGHSMGEPPTNFFTSRDARRLAPTPQLDEETHEYFRDLARQDGLYCGGDDADECTINGLSESVSSNIQQDEFDALNTKVLYLEFDSGDPTSNRFVWTLRYPTLPCNKEPAVVIVRNGSLKIQGQGAGANSSSFFGAIFVEDGTFESEGGYVIDGTIIAKTLEVGGSGTYSLSQCWLENAPGTHIELQPLGWHERDRPRT